MLLDDEPRTDCSTAAELAEVAELAEGAALTGDPARFFAAFRASGLPFLPQKHADDPRGLFRATLAVAHGLGERSPGLALGVSQHLASLWAFDLTRALTSQGDRMSDTVGRFLAEVYDRRLLIANTTSQVSGQRIGESGSVISGSGGSQIVEGSSTYMSLATEADKITFLTRDAAGIAVGVITDLDDGPGLTISDELLFGDNLVLADTRRLRFDNLVVAEEDVVGPDARLELFYLVQLTLQTLCVTALNLGGAYRILEETKAFGHGTLLPSGDPLSSSGAYSAEVGRLAITYFTSLRLLQSCDERVREVASGGSDPERSLRALRTATAVKHAVMRDVEDIARECRKIVGARSFMGSHPISRVGGEVLFGALGPLTEKNTEREFGEWYLAR